mmetsp:Transcript_23/g.48  ORF Transcript_23/g.48 Transcript_23/m.48 type:complete len:444 (+) Transcript_23:72-1403(+)
MDDQLKVLVVGDHKVGKSSLVHWLEHGGAPKTSPRPTVGSSLHVLESFGMGTNFLVDIREVGGHGAFESARPVFYSSSTAYDAIIIVFSALDQDRPEKRWVRELEGCQGYEAAVASESGGCSGRIEEGFKEQIRDIDDDEDEEAPSSPPHRMGSPVVDSEPDLSSLLSIKSSARVQWTRRAEGCLPTLFVANKADLLLGHTSQGATSSEVKTHQKMACNDAVLVSAMYPDLDTYSFHDFFHFALLQKQARQHRRPPPKGCPGSGDRHNESPTAFLHDPASSQKPRPHIINNKTGHYHYNDTRRATWDDDMRVVFEHSDDENLDTFSASSATTATTAATKSRSQSIYMLPVQSFSPGSSHSQKARQRTVSHEYRQDSGCSSGLAGSSGAASHSLSSTSIPSDPRASPHVSEKLQAAAETQDMLPHQHLWSPSNHGRAKDKGKLM